MGGYLGKVPSGGPTLPVQRAFTIGCPRARHWQSLSVSTQCCALPPCHGASMPPTFKLGPQVRSGQVRSGQVRSGQVRSGQVRSGQVRSGGNRHPSGTCGSRGRGTAGGRKQAGVTPADIAHPRKPARSRCQVLSARRRIEGLSVPPGQLREADRTERPPAPRTSLGQAAAGPPTN